MQNIKKIFLSLIITSISLGAFYFGVLAVIPNVIDLNKYKNSILENIEKETGLKCSIENISIKRSFLPSISIHMYHSVILYPDGEIFLKVKDADLKVKILPLLFKNVVIKDANLTRPIINITIYEDLSTSLEKVFNSEKNIKPNGFKLNGVLYDILCQNYKLKIKDETIDKNFYLEGQKLLIKDLKLNENVHVILDGSLYENEKEYIKYNLDLISVLTDKKNLTFSPFKHIIESDINAKIDGNLKLNKNNDITGSININDLALRIDNVLLKDNLVNLHFNPNNEIKINSVFHTSKSDVAEIKGKYSYGKKNYIDIDTKAKNVSIENLIKIVSGISNILNVDNPLNDINVKGLLNADFNLKSDFKKLKSTGKAEVHNGTITHKTLPYSVTGVNAKFDLNNNRVLIENLSAKINKTPVNITGYINEDVSYSINAFSDNLNLINIINLFNLKNKIPINIQNGLLSFKSEIKGVGNKKYNIVSDIIIENLKFKDNLYNLPVNIKSLNIKASGNDQKYSGEIICNNVSSIAGKNKITSDEFKVLFNDKKITIPDNVIQTSGSFIINGFINDYQKNPSGNVNYSGEFSSAALGEVLKSNINMPYKALGNLKTVGKVSFSKDNIALQSQFKADENNYLSYIVIGELLRKSSLLDIDCVINNGNINIKNLTLYEDTVKTPENIYRTGLEKLKKIITVSGGIIKDKDIVFNNIKIIIPESLTVATNFFGGEDLSLKCNLVLNKTLKNSEIKGNATLFKYNIKKYLTSIKNADLNFSKDNIRITAPDVKVVNSNLNITADIIPTLDLNNIIVSNMQMNSIKIDLNTILSSFDSEIDIYTKPFLTIKKGIITVNNLSFLDLKAKDICSDIAFDKNILNLSNINAKAYTGSIAGEIVYNVANKDLNIDITGNDIDIKTSLYDLCKISDNIAGKADFKSHLYMLTGTYNSVIKSLKGEVEYKSKNGKLGTLGKFEYYLYAKNLLYHGLLNATLNRIADSFVRDETTNYRESEGIIKFDNGYIIADEIKTSGINMSLFITGKHNLITNISDIDIYGRISDDVKSKLGSFGNVSISELITGESDKKDVTVIKIPYEIISKIPDLYNNISTKTNTFKVNVLGNINSLNAINSFVWTVSDEYIREQNNNNNINSEEINSNTNETKIKGNLPDFSDITQQNI